MPGASLSRHRRDRGVGELTRVRCDARSGPRMPILAPIKSSTAGKYYVKDQVKKIARAQCRPEDFYKFTEDLTVYVSAINFLLNRLQLSYSK